VTGRLTLLVLSAVVLVTGASAAPSTPAEGELGYTVTLRGYVFSASTACVGSIGGFRSAHRLTSGISSWERYEVSWAPDGDRVAIAGGSYADTAIRVAATDGTDTHAVSRPEASERDSSPTWSPDGTRIAFARYGSRSGIWIVDLRTDEERRISNEFAWSLDWASGGGLIAADTTQEFPRDVLILSEDGSLVRRVPRPNRPSFETGVSWSPDGSRLAIGGGLILDRAGDIVGNYASGSRFELVVRSPEWSPDGATIVYVRVAVHDSPRTNTRYLGPGDLYSAPARGGTESRLTLTPDLDEGGPDFRPLAGTKPALNAPCVISGTSGHNVIRGTAGADLIDAGRGNDLVYGLGGNDLLVGGPGHDRLVGGTGRDLFDGGAGNDRLYSRDRARDTLSGGLGIDRAWIDRSGDWTQGVEINYRRREEGLTK
jgi:dipeptidyl aminopeptidase/acylaminoacyl peptidase